MTTKTLISCFIFLLLTLTIQFPSANTSPLEDFCNMTRHPDLCKKVLTSDGQSPYCTTALCLAENATRDSAQAATDSKNFILNYLPKAAKEDVPALSYCLAAYGTNRQYLDLGVSNLMAHSYKSALEDVAASEDTALNCEKQFGRKPTPLTNLNDQFGYTCQFSWDLVHYVYLHQ